MPFSRTFPLMCLSIGLLAAAAAAQAPARPLSPALLNLTSAGPNRPDEPIAARASLDRTREFLDALALQWTRDRKCGTCHTNYAYMMARPTLGPPTPAAAEVRAFFEHRAENWDTDKGDNPEYWPSEVVATAVTLSLNDAASGRTLQHATRAALDRMWTIQRTDGSWSWIKAANAPLEGSDYYGAAFAAVGVGYAPDQYARTREVQAGLEKLSGYLQRGSRGANLHDRAVVLWASAKIRNLLSAEQRRATVTEIRSLQHADGGWSLPSLGPWKRLDGTPNDPGAPSDGYGTGLVAYVLSQIGVPCADGGLARALDWLGANQRESGRWFTRSLNRDSYHFISHAGTAYAAMALEACGYWEKI